MTIEKTNLVVGYDVTIMSATEPTFLGWIRLHAPNGDAGYIYFDDAAPIKPPRLGVSSPYIVMTLPTTRFADVVATLKGSTPLQIRFFDPQATGVAPSAFLEARDTGNIVDEEAALLLSRAGAIASRTLRATKVGAELTWTNQEQTVTGSVASIVKPTSVVALIGIVDAAVSNKKTLQVVGRGYSTSRVLAPTANPILVDTSALVLDNGNLVSFPCAAPFFPASDNQHVCVSAAARVDDVLRTVTAATPAKCLQTMGAFSGQSFIGAMSTATHGSGFDYGTLADLVEAIELVSVVNGSAQRMIIRRGDPAFSAAVVGFGVPGIVTAAAVRVVDNVTVLRVCEKNIIDWAELRGGWLSDVDERGRPNQFLTDAKGRAVDSVGVLICPYRIPGHDFGCAISRTFVTPTRPAGAIDPVGAPCSLLTRIAQGWLGSIPLDERKKVIFNELVAQSPKEPQFGTRATVLTSAAGFGGVIGYGLEYAFAIEPTRKYLDAIQDILMTIDALSNAQAPLTIPGFVSLRFQGVSCALMAHRPGPTCTVEVLTAASPGNGATMLPLLEAVALKHGGKPHWGQVFAMGNTIKSLDGKRLETIARNSQVELRSWREALQAANIDTTTFRNEVTDALWNA